MLEAFVVLIALVGSITVAYAIQRMLLQVLFWFMTRMS